MNSNTTLRGAADAPVLHCNCSTRDHRSRWYGYLGADAR